MAGRGEKERQMAATVIPLGVAKARERWCAIKVSVSRVMARHQSLRSESDGAPSKSVHQRAQIWYRSHLESTRTTSSWVQAHGYHHILHPSLLLYFYLPPQDPHLDIVLSRHDVFLHFFSASPTFPAFTCLSKISGPSSTEDISLLKNQF